MMESEEEVNDDGIPKEVLFLEACSQDIITGIKADAVQIVASKYDPKTGNTIYITGGIGNIYARRELAAEFVRRTV